MYRRFTSATIALLLAVGAPAGAARAEGASQPAVPAPPMPPQPSSGPGSSTTPGNPAPVPEPKITSAQAEAALQGLFRLPEASDKVQLEWHQSTDGIKPTWDLQVSIRQGNGSMGFSLATVDALTGRVLRYGGYDNMLGAVRTGTLGAVRTAEEAQARAWALVQKLAPEKAEVLRLSPVPNLSQFQRYYFGYPAEGTGDAYSFTWVEYHDGVPFPSSSATVRVDKQSLDYVSVNVNLLDAINFQAGPAKVTADAALQFWQGETKPALTYVPLVNSYPYGMSKATGYSLVYAFGNPNRAVDATAGTWVQDPSPFAPPAEAKPAAEAEAVPVGNVAPVVPNALPLSDVDARQFAAAVLQVPQSANLRSTDAMFSEEKLIHVQLFDDKSSSSLMLEPNTGLIRSANRFARSSGSTAPKPGGSEAPKLTPEQEAQAKQAAFAVVQTYYSQIRQELRLDASPPRFGGPQENQLRRFRFARSVNGLSVPNESVNVTIDLATMSWRDMSASWTTGLPFPSPAGSITAETAKATAMADRKPILIYRLVYPAVNKEQPVNGRAPRPTEAALAYILTPDVALQVDALSGQLLDFDGRPASDIESAYKRVAGHVAEGELRFLLARRVLRPDQIQPDGPLSRGQAVAMLLSRTESLSWTGSPAEVPYSDLPETDPAYGAVRMALIDGWLHPIADKAFRPSHAVTRAEFAVWAARALGLGDLARTTIAVDAGYKDLAGLGGEERNAISFLRAMGLLPAADTFRPSDALTQAEGAALTVRIYNYLLER